MNNCKYPKIISLISIYICTQEIIEFLVYNPYNYLYFIKIWLFEIHVATGVCEIVSKIGNHKLPSPTVLNI